MENSVDTSDSNTKNAAEENSKDEGLGNDGNDSMPTEKKILEDETDNSGRYLTHSCSVLTICRITLNHRQCKR